jgi:hypothetical protein
MPTLADMLRSLPGVEANVGNPNLSQQAMVKALRNPPNPAYNFGGWVTDKTGSPGMGVAANLLAGQVLSPPGAAMAPVVIKGGKVIEEGAEAAEAAYRPDKQVPIYRAVPKEAPSEINAGDWVTVNREYAKEHGESTLEGAYKIVKKTVKARDIFTNGDSIHEWGYDPQPMIPIAEQHPDLVPGWFRAKIQNTLTEDGFKTWYQSHLAKWLARQK